MASQESERLMFGKQFSFAELFNLDEPPWYGPVCLVVWEGKPVRASLSRLGESATRQSAPAGSNRSGTDKLTSRLVQFTAYARLMWSPHDSKTQRHVVPQGQASRSETSIMFGRYQMAPQIEKIVDSSVCARKPLRLMH